MKKKIHYRCQLLVKDNFTSVNTLKGIFLSSTQRRAMTILLSSKALPVENLIQVYENNIE